MSFKLFFFQILAGFEEYEVSPHMSNQNIPKLDILPVEEICPSELVPPPLDIFTNEYLTKYHATFEENGFFARGDNRSPEELGFIIKPKCFDSKSPHYNIKQHRNDSECSGFVSLTSDMRVANKFGDVYALLKSTNSYYIYIAKMLHGLSIDPMYDRFYDEFEHSAIGPVEVISYRKCERVKHTYECGNIFIRKDLNQNLKQKILASQISPNQKTELVFSAFQYGLLSGVALSFSTDVLDNIFKKQNYTSEQRYWINQFASGLVLLYLGSSPLTVVSISLFNFILGKYLSQAKANYLTTSVALGLNIMNKNSLTRASMTVMGNIAGSYAYDFVKKGFGFFGTQIKKVHCVASNQNLNTL